MPVRYMGTKRHMVDAVRETVLSLHPEGAVVDLFAGMGTVAASLAADVPIVANDALGFVACIARARFLGADRMTPSDAAAKRLLPAFEAHARWLCEFDAERLDAERIALDASDPELATHMRRAAHVASSATARRAAQAASRSSSRDFYRMSSLYFSTGYFTHSQAIALDALRAAIDADTVVDERDWLLSAWLGAASAVMNAPGHTAQYLFPRSHAAAERVRRAARLDVWELFVRALSENVQVGTGSWRAQNKVTSSDALTLLNSNAVADASVLYADPPYTRDQYSRFYHVYETLYRYDYPDSRGQGRNRSDGFMTDFSKKSGVEAAFRALLRGARRMQLPLVISYPENGLLTTAGATVLGVANEFYANVEVFTVAASHSTMGGSKGSQRKSASEQLFVLTN